MFFLLLKMWELSYSSYSDFLTRFCRFWKTRGCGFVRSNAFLGLIADSSLNYSENCWLAQFSSPPRMIRLNSNVVVQRKSGGLEVIAQYNNSLCLDIWVKRVFITWLALKFSRNCGRHSASSECFHSSSTISLTPLPSWALANDLGSSQYLLNF